MATGRKFIIENLPPEEREGIRRWLVDHEFHGCLKLSEELRARGVSVGASALYRYAQRLKRESAAARSVALGLGMIAAVLKNRE